MTSLPETRRSAHLSRAIVASAGGATLLLGALAFPGAASAHNYLASSTPEAGSTLTELPAEFQVTTNDDLLDTGAGLRAFAMQVVGADGLFYGDGCVSVDGPTMTSVAELGPEGDYTLAWQVVSIDGHPVDGTIDFAWDPASPDMVSTGSEAPPVCGEATVETGAEGAAADEAEATPAPSVPAADPVETGTSARGTEAASVPSMVFVGGILFIAALVGGISYAVWRRRRP